MSLLLSHRPTYTDAQIDQFHRRIRLPQQHRHLPSSPSLQIILESRSTSLTHLTRLMKHTLASIPFENLSLHYSPHRTISLDPAFLFDKIVSGENNARGGYCMENNALLGTVLRSLGFEVISAGARVNEAAGPTTKAREDCAYGGWSHMVNLVLLPGGDSSSGADGAKGGERKAYLVDVGFGAGGPTIPVPLEEGFEWTNIAPGGKGRLIRERIPQFTSQRKIWVFEKKSEDLDDADGGNAVQARYMPAYCFTEEEFLPQDFAVMNLSTSTSRSSWFTFKIVCMKQILNEDGSETIGELILSEREVKRRVRGKTEWRMELTSEEERVKALEDVFGIMLSEAEKNGIKGLPSMIR